MTEETKDILLRAVDEITSLRRQNELMNAKLEMFDSLMLVLNTQPAYPRTQGMSPDIVWEMRKLASKETTTKSPANE